jgi:hypothetical protein
MLTPSTVLSLSGAAHHDLDRALQKYVDDTIVDFA